MFNLNFYAGNNKKDKVKAIQNSAIYAGKTEGHLLCLYYLVAWNNYLKEKNTLETIINSLASKKANLVFL